MIKYHHVQIFVMLSPYIYNDHQLCSAQRSFTLHSLLCHYEETIVGHQSLAVTRDSLAGCIATLIPSRSSVPD